LRGRPFLGKFSRRGIKRGVIFFSKKEDFTNGDNREEGEIIFEKGIPNFEISYFEQVHRWGSLLINSNPRFGLIKLTFILYSFKFYFKKWRKIINFW